jgi:hypothetical protein
MNQLALKLLTILTCIWSSSLVDSFNHKISILKYVIELIKKSV